jgi:hypothetical protein
MSQQAKFTELAALLSRTPLAAFHAADLPLLMEAHPSNNARFMMKKADIDYLIGKAKAHHPDEA